VARIADRHTPGVAEETDVAKIKIKQYYINKTLYKKTPSEQELTAKTKIQ